MGGEFSASHEGQNTGASAGSDQLETTDVGDAGTSSAPRIAPRTVDAHRWSFRAPFLHSVSFAPREQAVTPAMEKLVRKLIREEARSHLFVCRRIYRCRGHALPPGPRRDETLDFRRFVEAAGRSDPFPPPPFRPGRRARRAHRRRRGQAQQHRAAAPQDPGARAGGADPYGPGQPRPRPATALSLPRWHTKEMLRALSR